MTDNSQIHTPYRYDIKNSFQKFEVSNIAESDNELLISSMMNVSEELGINVFFRNIDPVSSGILPQRNAIIVYYLMGNDQRLKMLPFSSTPSREEFNQSELFYTSDSVSNAQGKLRLVSGEYPSYIGSLLKYQGALNNRELFILDSNQEKTETFLSQVQSETGAILNPLPLTEDDVFFRLKPSVANFMMVKNGIRAPQILVISTSLVAMVLTYLSWRKRFSIRLLHGYKYRYLFFQLIKDLVMPTFAIAGVFFIPFSLVQKINLSHGLKPTMIAFIPLLLVFIGMQLLICGVLLIDLKLHSPVRTLKQEKNQTVLASLAIGIKIVVLILGIPLLLYNFNQFDQAISFYKQRNQQLKEYHNVWILQLDLANTNLANYNHLGQRIESKFDGKTLTWFKAFYDTIRDEYPVVTSVISGVIGNENNRAFEIRVNGNFVKVNQLRDANGVLLEPDNNVKMVLMSEDRENTRNYIKTLPGQLDYFSTVTTPFDPDGFLESWQIEEVEPIVVNSDETLKSYSFDMMNPEFQQSMDRYVLVVNSMTIPHNLDSMKFVGMSVTQRSELLEKVAHLPFARHLRWQSFSEYYKQISSVFSEQSSRAITETISIVLAFVAYSIFLYLVVYEWLANRLAVQYLFGKSYWRSAKVILLLNLALTIVVFALMVRISAVFDPKQIPQVFIFLVALDILFFGLSHFYYSRKTLRNLKLRE